MGVVVPFVAASHTSLAPTTGGTSLEVELFVADVAASGGIADTVA